MYIAGLVIPVPEDKKETYRKWAENGAQIFKEYGCLEIVECREDCVPDGKQTDFRRAVAAKERERSSSLGKSGPTRRASMPPKGRCTRTSAGYVRGCAGPACPSATDRTRFTPAGRFVLSSSSASSRMY